jgi:hypothetical protein
MTSARPRRALVLLAATTLLAVLVTGSASQAATSKPYGAFGITVQAMPRIPFPAYAEPTIAIASDGRHVVMSTPGSDAQGNGTVQIWYSKDDGKTWRHTYNTADGGGGDSEVDFLPNGTLLSADLRIQDSFIQMSRDYGATWAPMGPAGTEQDRQWLAHAPNGTAFLNYHDIVLEAEWYTASPDGGKTWSTSLLDQHLVNSPNQIAPPAIVGNGGDASIIDQGVNTFSGPMVVAPNGVDYYVFYGISDLQTNINPQSGVPPFGRPRQLVVAHSGDAGQSWTNRVAYEVATNPNGAAEADAISFWPWGFVDSAGTVYGVFNSTEGAPTDHFHQYYVFSKDKGATWSAPVKIDGLPMGQGAAVYGTGDDVRKGVIDIAWYQSNTGTPANDQSFWTPWFAQITGADTAHPKVKRQAVTNIPNHHGGICLQGILCGIAPGSSDRSLLDFFELAVNPKTKMAQIAYADNYRLGDNHDIGTVVFAKQTKAP